MEFAIYGVYATVQQTQQRTKAMKSNEMHAKRPDIKADVEVNNWKEGLVLFGVGLHRYHRPSHGLSDGFTKLLHKRFSQPDRLQQRSPGEKHFLHYELNIQIKSNQIY